MARRVGWRRRDGARGRPGRQREQRLSGGIGGERAPEAGRQEGRAAVAVAVMEGASYEAGATAAEDGARGMAAARRGSEEAGAKAGAAAEAEMGKAATAEGDMAIGAATLAVETAMAATLAFATGAAATLAVAVAAVATVAREAAAAVTTVVETLAVLRCYHSGCGDGGDVEVGDGGGAAGGAKGFE